MSATPSRPTPAPVALITGASRGLGRATATALAHEGWQLVITGRNADALRTAAAALSSHTTVWPVAGDVTDEAHRQSLLATVTGIGRLDVLIHNAGILGPSPQPALADYPLDVLEDVFRANTFAPLRLTQLLLPALRQSDGRVISISSDAGVEAYPGWGGYGASKAALEHLTRVLAVENPDVPMLVVDPGDMNTRMHQEAFPGEDISDRPAPEASVPGLLALIGDGASGRYQARKVTTVGQEVA